MNQIIYADLPISVKGMIVKTFDDGEDHHTIVLNSRHSWETQEVTKIHEAQHLDFQDFDLANCPVDTIEWIRHEKTAPGGTGTVWISG